MSINIIQIQRWAKMLAGKSIEHVNQNIGKVYNKTKLEGYYNDLTEKVTKDKSLLYCDDLPIVKQIDGKEIYFPVAIFQYALGCYDLWLLDKDAVYKIQFLPCAEWALQKQDSLGRWDNFSHVYPESPYGAMAQGEAVSVLLRAYKLTGENKFYEAAKRAIDFMLLDLKEGGTSEYKNGDVFFWEYTNQPIVLNGWIFSWWGLFDYVLVTQDNGKYKNLLQKSLDTLSKNLYRFRNRYWSLYDLDHKLASPFYHNLHIAQMQAMYELTGREIFRQFAYGWVKQQRNPFCKLLAFSVKAVQKIIE